MGIVGNENEWWNDVLENGPCARHAGFFDIDWRPNKIELRDKVLLCLLAEPFGKVLESGQLTLSYKSGAFVIHYFQHRFPVAPESSLSCLRLRCEELEQALGTESTEFMDYQSILTALSHLPPRAEAHSLKTDERYREMELSCVFLGRRLCYAPVSSCRRAPSLRCTPGCEGSFRSAGGGHHRHRFLH